MSQLSLYFLGTPRIERDQVVVPLGTRKAVALLAYLALAQAACYREVLASLFWPESPAEKGRATLRRTLYTLHQALGPEWIQTTRTTVALHPAAGHTLWVDAVHLQQLLHRVNGRPQNNAKTLPAEDTVNDLMQAVALYRGDFLQGLTLGDTLDFDAWLCEQSHRLHHDMVHALEIIANACVARQQWQAALAHTRRWLALDPYHEPAHRLLMTLHAQSGERTAALQQYQRCVRLLGNDLQTEPETETTHLYLHLRDGQTGGEDIRAIATTPLTRSHRHNLPVPPTPFVGREGEMAQITRLLAEPHCRLLTKYDCFQKALQAAWKIHSAPLALNVLTGIGMVWHQQGDVQAALALWVFALAHPANDQPQREVAIRLLRKVDPGLPQRITAVAQTTETGLALDTVVTAVLDSAVPVTAVGAQRVRAQRVRAQKVRG